MSAGKMNITAASSTHMTKTDGFLSIRELNDLIESREYEHNIPGYVVRKIHRMLDQNDEHIDFEEFVDMINQPELQSVFDNFLNKYLHFIVPQVTYEEQYSCWPPAVGMLMISMIEVFCYVFDKVYNSGSTELLAGPMGSSFVYNPRKRYQVWRFLTYIFVHVSTIHLIVNLLVQILLGIPLEMVHKWWRVLIVYFSGVIAGSLAISITDLSYYLAGAIGGIYSLLTAHFATIIMNWRQMRFPTVQFIFFLLATGSTIFYGFHWDIGYAVHFAGALSGLLVGLNVLRNLVVTKVDRIVWWASIVTYCLLMSIAIVWNFAFPSYFQDYI